jgi:hypothetical protein
MYKEASAKMQPVGKIICWLVLVLPVMGSFQLLSPTDFLALALWRKARRAKGATC